MAFLFEDKKTVCNGVTVKEYLLTHHNPNKISIPSPRAKKLKGITIHNTDRISVKGTTMAEQYTRATVNGNMNTVRVHYYVDEVEAWQNLPLDYQSWHAADGQGDGNTATISIECIMGSMNDERAEDNCAKLTAWLLHQNGLTTADVYTHTYWLNVRDGKGAELSKDARCILKHTYKVCPIYIIPHWNKFIERVQIYLDKLNKATPTAEDKLYRVQVGAFRSKANAEKLLEDVRKHFPDAYIK